VEQLILIFHVLFAVALIGLVLLQKGKGAGMGAAFGSGASQTVFGSKGSIGFLMKLTLFIAALFFATSIGLTYLAAHQTKTSQTEGVLTNVEQISKQFPDKQQQTNQKAKAKKPVVVNKKLDKSGKK
jgi:preprotein translocase subunit SecG